MSAVGQNGLLAKDAEPAVLADAIRAVAAGRQVADPNLALTVGFLRPDRRLYGRLGARERFRNC